MVVNGTEIPRTLNGADRSPRRPKTSSNASPATDGGRTMGRSTTVSIRPLPRNARRASTNASGRPSTSVITRLIEVVTRLSHRASRTAGVARATWSEPVEHGPTDEGQDRQAEEQREQHGHRGDRSFAPPTSTTRRGDDRGDGEVGHLVGGRNPKPLRIA